MTLFEKIINRTIAATIVFEDDQCIVIEDIAPVAPCHLLIIPKQVMPKLVHANQEDAALLGHLLLVANQVAVQVGVQEAFRVVINNGSGAGQSIFHLHLHLIAGRPLQWPPG
tara:strand:+ start:202 stop:537 length:336 start_codon:yes stop_codon:yes gene_type:complete